MSLRPTFMGLETMKKALYASQKALDIVGNNISNIESEGYTRQKVDYVSVNNITRGLRYNTSVSTAGQGVRMTGVQQLRDPLLDQQFRNHSAGANKSGNIKNILSSMENIIGLQNETDFDDVFNDFVSALKQYEAYPYQESYGKTVQTAAQKMVTTIRDYGIKLQGIADSVKTDISTTCEQANGIFKQIAALNEKIKVEYTASGNYNYINGEYVADTKYGPLELKDQLNYYVDELSAYGNVELNVNKDGTYQVMFAGVEMVNDQVYKTLEMTEHASGALVLNAVTASGNKTELRLDASSLDSGSLRGLLDMYNGAGIYADDPSLRADGTKTLVEQVNTLLNDASTIFNDTTLTPTQKSNQLLDLEKQLREYDKSIDIDTDPASPDFGKTTIGYTKEGLSEVLEQAARDAGLTVTKDANGYVDGINGPISGLAQLQLKKALKGCIDDKSLSINGGVIGPGNTGVTINAEPKATMEKLTAGITKENLSNLLQEAIAKAGGDVQTNSAGLVTRILAPTSGTPSLTDILTAVRNDKSLKDYIAGGFINIANGGAVGMPNAPSEKITKTRMYTVIDVQCNDQLKRKEAVVNELYVSSETKLDEKQKDIDDMLVKLTDLLTGKKAGTEADKLTIIQDLQAIDPTFAAEIDGNTIVGLKQGDTTIITSEALTKKSLNNLMKQIQELNFQRQKALSEGNSVDYAELDRQFNDIQRQFSDIASTKGLKFTFEKDITDPETYFKVSYGGDQIITPHQAYREAMSKVESLLEVDSFLQENPTLNSNDCDLITDMLDGTGITVTFDADNEPTFSYGGATYTRDDIGKDEFGNYINLHVQLLNDTFNASMPDMQAKLTPNVDDNSIQDLVFTYNTGAGGIKEFDPENINSTDMLTNQIFSDSTVGRGTDKFVTPGEVTRLSNNTVTGFRVLIGDPNQEMNKISIGAGTILDTMEEANKTNYYTSTNGVLYYQKVIDALANTIARSFNDALCPDKELQQLGLLMFEPGGPDVEINASNISISQEWLNNALLLSQKKTPILDANGKVTKYELSTPSHTELGKQMIEAITRLATDGKLDFTIGRPDGSGTIDFSNNITEYYKTWENKLANAINDETRTLKATEALVETVLNERDAYGGVEINEEGSEMMVYQKWFNAAARMATTMDEALNTIINNMGMVGR